MRRTAFFLTAAALIVGAANVGAQTPNFTGTWTRIADSNAPTTGGRGATPLSMTIAQDSKAMTMMETGVDGPKFVFNIDGTDSKATATDGDGNPSEVITRGKWDGSTFVATMIRHSNGTSVPATYACSLDASGHLVVVVNLQPPGGGAPVTMTSSYTKS